ncbi:MAG: hypothetical protein GXP63_00500 [DPANN group archaeon]|nr:hypothetical protein [DPANN group archaeon]
MILLFQEGPLLKILVIYYSLTGKSEAVARGIAHALDADLFRVEASSPERVLSINTFRVGFSSRVMHTSVSNLRRRRTQLKVPRYDFKKYGSLIVVTTVWGAFFPPAMNTFLELNPFKGKCVGFVALAPPFSTAHGLLDYAEAHLTKVDANLIFRTEIRLFQQSKKQLEMKGRQLGRIIAPRLS